MAQQNPFSMPQTPAVSASPPSDINPVEPLKSIGGYDATTRGLDTGTQTVAGRVNGLIQQDSPLLQTAQTGATQAANARGLKNSSMAVQAGQQAVINTALPIASADAAFANDVANRNMDALNTASQFGAGARNTGALAQLQGNQQLGQITAQTEAQKQLNAQNAQLQTQLEQQRGQIQLQLQTADAQSRAALLEKQGQIDTQLQQLKGSQDLGMQQLRGDQATQLAQIEGRYKQLAQVSDTAARSFAVTQQTISDILQNPDMDATAKQTQVDKQISLLRSNLAIQGPLSNVDVLSLLQF